MFCLSSSVGEYPIVYNLRPKLYGKYRVFFSIYSLPDYRSILFCRKQFSFSAIDHVKFEMFNWGSPIFSVIIKERERLGLGFLKDLSLEKKKFNTRWMCVCMWVGVSTLLTKPWCTISFKCPHINFKIFISKPFPTTDGVRVKRNNKIWNYLIILKTNPSVFDMPMLRKSPKVKHVDYF